MDEKNGCAVFLHGLLLGQRVTYLLMIASAKNPGATSGETHAANPG
jgi:hypothetical protein